MPQLNRSKPPRRLIGAVALCLISFIATQPSQAAPSAGAVLPERINEASGLAASKLHPGVYWTHNDNIDLHASSRKSQPILFAINTEGDSLASLTLTDATQRDWEALTEANLDGTPTLIVGDIGDNRGTWPDYRLWFVPEPAELSPQKITTGATTATPTAVLRFRYPDQTAIKNKANGTIRWLGGHDNESMAYDPRSKEILILTKREKPARLFALPLAARTILEPNGSSTISQQIRTAPVAIAQFIANLPPLPAPNLISWLLHPFISPFADQPTDMALSPDGRVLAVLTYNGLFFFLRAPQQSWQTALTAPARAQALPFIDQWEGISYSPDGKTLIIVREGTGADTLISIPAPDLTP